MVVWATNIEKICLDICECRLSQPPSLLQLPNQIFFKILNLLIWINHDSLECSQLEFGRDF